MKHLFILDPIQQINQSKDSSAALMEAAHRASIDVWICTPSDLQAKGEKAGVFARPVVPEPWISIGNYQKIALNVGSSLRIH